MSFLFNKQKVPSKISFKEPTKTTLSQKELSDITVDRSQAVKKLKTYTSIDNVELDSNTSTASSSASNTLTNVEPTSSTHLVDNSEDSMAVDTKKIDESGNFADTLESLTNPTANSASEHQSSSSAGNRNDTSENTNEQEFIQVSRITKFFALIPA